MAVAAQQNVAEFAPIAASELKFDLMTLLMRHRRRAFHASNG